MDGLNTVRIFISTGNDSSLRYQPLSLFRSLSGKKLTIEGSDNLQEARCSVQTVSTGGKLMSRADRPAA